MFASGGYGGMKDIMVMNWLICLQMLPLHSRQRDLSRFSHSQHVLSSHLLASKLWKNGQQGGNFLPPVARPRYFSLNQTPRSQRSFWNWTGQILACASDIWLVTASLNITDPRWSQVSTQDVDTVLPSGRRVHTSYLIALLFKSRGLIVSGNTSRNP